MDCPYCAEPIKESAIVCKHCCRDLFVIRPLMDKLADATKRLAAFEATQTGAAPPVAAPQASGLPWIDPIAAMTLSFIALVVAHYVIIVEYSLPLISLRVVSIVVPMIFGLLCRESGHRTMAVEFAYGVIVSLASILVMSTVVGKVDNVPVMPRNFYEWRELAEYGASIAFGFFTGVILRQTLIAMRTPEAKPNWLIGALAKVVADKLGGEAAGFNVKTVQTLISTGTAVGSGVTSVWTGLSQFF